MTRFDISSTSNPRIKRLIALQRKRARDTEGVFVVEGQRLFDRALAAGLAPLEVYVDGSTETADLEVIRLPPEVLDRASYRERSEGLIAVFDCFSATLDQVELGEPPLVLAAEGLEKPGNLGAVLRIADAVGADLVVTVGESIDLFNPNALRASTGAIFTVPVVATGLAELLRWLADREIELIAGHPTARQPYWALDLAGPVAIIIGAEDTGLSDLVLSNAARSVSIPMLGSSDSLNAANALAIIAFEVLRQRSVGG